jgi:colanic acid/amylovoran biosynthesis protein
MTVHTYGIIGGTLWGNRGAEAMVVTTIGRVRDRDPGAHFVLFSYMPERDRRLAEDPKVQVLDAGPRQVALVHFPFAVLCWLASLLRLSIPDAMLPSDVAVLRNCRVIFDVSGISFHDGRLAVVAYNVLCLWPAMMLKVPVVRLSQAMGPFRHPLNRLPARLVMTRSLQTYARGRLTADHLRGLNIPEARWTIAADVAFAYRDSDSITSENEDAVAAVLDRLKARAGTDIDVVAVVPSSLVLKKSIENEVDYVGQMAQLIRHLQRRGLHVLVMPNATRSGVDTLRNNDIVVVNELRSRLTSAPNAVEEDTITFVDFDLNTASIRSLIKKCELVVTSRFHAMVAALALGVPPLVLGWSHKYEEVLEMFGLSDNAIDFSSAEGEILPMVDRILDEAAAAREKLSAARHEVIRSAEAQFDVLDRLPGA